MDSGLTEPTLHFPHAEPPPFGELREIAPGVLWLRLPLPFRLDHVNIHLIEDGAGWAVLDTGIGDRRSREIWEAVLDGPLAGRRLTRMIVTHYHPDHVGLAGWLAHRFDLPLWMPRPEYLFSLALANAPGDLGVESWRPFYRRHGLSEPFTDRVLDRGHLYLRCTTGVPSTYRRIKHEDEIDIGGRRFTVLTGGGHALEQAMLLCPEEKLFFSADQVIAKISPNVSVTAMEPEADALGIYLASLAALRRRVPADVLVLAGHGLPFHGLHLRIDELIAHHAARCALIADATRAQSLSAAEIVPLIFPSLADEHQLGFAFGEIMAHVNHMLSLGELTAETDEEGEVRFRAAG
ncbi:MBL fold metallo-hydrolase [Rhodovastum atsumiense]|uniref:MBL fold metallo-hydrolase n=1 Tax=Rhodovastum atsumiense TaxID=504468 RepID=A0A5M6ISS5_9PROT|nr:MBL fold metallo-hydrolase [Rhodovastum atsumiense]KAA5611366.1 MBL fold metallo-hydrolase [Rhodovastum atsumiense]CAH2603638.1 MBL fold metallo-hydrolase [Rhodovastum atsumiense]